MARSAARSPLAHMLCRPHPPLPPPTRYRDADANYFIPLPTKGQEPELPSLADE